jgi:nucleotide-binding universal stress UspA family protein
MIGRILLGVSDSPAGLAAARAALELAVTCGASVRAVHVLSDGEIDAALVAASAEARAAGGAGTAERRLHSADAVLRHVLVRADEAGVVAEAVQRWGEPAEHLLAEARRWRADLVVIGRGEAPSPTHRPLGAEALRVLEFADVPVLVVPPPADTRAG